MDCFDAFPHHLLVSLLTKEPPAVVAKGDVHNIGLGIEEEDYDLKESKPTPAQEPGGPTGTSLRKAAKSSGYS